MFQEKQRNGSICHIFKKIYDVMWYDVDWHVSIDLFLVRERSISFTLMNRECKEVCNYKTACGVLARKTRKLPIYELL
jgi:hypothetical protein